MGEPLRLLIIEDDEADAELLRIELERGGFDVTWRRVDTEEDLRRALDEFECDLVVSDFAMPSFDGLHAFDVFKSRGLDIPFIFVSGALGEERAVEAMRAGARDYLLKGYLARLTVAVRRELQEARNRRQQRATEEAARRQQRRLAMAVEASGAGVFEYWAPADMYFSERCAEVLGYQENELPGFDGFFDWMLEIVHPDDRADFQRARAAFAAGQTDQCKGELRLRHRDGHWVEVEVNAKAIQRTDDGTLANVVGVLLDLTERKRLEAQFRQAQKMEAVGRLAGGVAHDFNNLLTIILSFGSFVRNALDPQSRAYQDLDEVLKAGNRAATLTGQLLAFSRRNTIAPRVINVNDVVKEADRMLRRVLGEDVELLGVLSPDIWNVKIDPGAFEQVLVNLAVNARDAMPEGGKLMIETENVRLDEGYTAGMGEVPAGSYVVVAMSDTGSGMDSATQARIFEPFFTTKELGKGTGLGLSTCYGIVNQAEGYIAVYSEPGKGTNFRIYLPKVSQPADLPALPPPTGELRGSEVVLVVEDDDRVRSLASRTLSWLGYKVIEASSGAEAVATYQDTISSVNLLLTDVVMPGMTGKQLADRLVALNPSLMVLYMSGYTPNSILQGGVLETGSHIVQKPFTPESLGGKVRHVLDERK
jgi:PAS domain S-box-containing protein